MPPKKKGTSLAQKKRNFFRVQITHELNRKLIHEGVVRGLTKAGRQKELARAVRRWLERPGDAVLISGPAMAWLSRLAETRNVDPSKVATDIILASKRLSLGNAGAIPAR